ncbi:hypothetical protein H1S01_18015 [Heliobacterium chlorum]|uniref:Uncharacterized protein n=1 Tax=Heliobacterium chlorum TaxID=2698 RepID=A0ABR7T801_HELCL|nr:hypothetical protein [Heliobacterium chlorum]MBC9786357.1 hypothetical protein [Heliobacterium chlorum]
MDGKTRHSSRIMRRVKAGIFAVAGVLLAGGLLAGCSQTTQTGGPPGSPAETSAKTQRGDYVIMSWQSIGMKCTSDNDKYFSFHTPGNDLWAQVIKRGDPPVIVTEGIELTYEAPANHRDPSKTINFWDYAPITLKKDIPKNVGKAGLAADQGQFKLDPVKKAWTAIGIPVSPYNDEGQVDAYPMFSVKAIETATGKLLTDTKVAAPVSGELGCYICHGGTPKRDGVGLSDDTARDILADHDKNVGTNLLAEAAAGRPQYCLDCHEANNVGAPGKPNVLSMSAALHGKHAQYMQNGSIETCGMCHPSSSKGQVYCERSVHRGFGMDCQSCHGTLPEHAASVLMKQKDLPAAQKSLARLKPFLPEGFEAKARANWINQPDCLSCHTDAHTKASTKTTSYNQWITDKNQLFRFDKADNGDMMCAACHGSPHMIYPASEALGYSEINYQPKTYQGFAGPIGANGNCTVCHLTEPENKDYHHRNQGQPFVPPAFANDPGK